MTNDNTKLPPLTAAEIAELRRLEAAAKSNQWPHNMNFMLAMRDAAPRLLAAAEREGRYRGAIQLVLRYIGDGANVPQGTYNFCLQVRKALTAALAETEEK